MPFVIFGGTRGKYLHHQIRCAVYAVTFNLVRVTYHHHIRDILFFIIQKQSVPVRKWLTFTAIQIVCKNCVDICRCAVAKGRAEGKPLYQYLKEPLVRRFGQQWYDELAEQCENKNNS